MFLCRDPRHQRREAQHPQHTTHYTGGNASATTSNAAAPNAAAGAAAAAPARRGGAIAIVVERTFIGNVACFKAAERRKEYKSAATINKSLPPRATFSNGLRGGSLETGEGVVLLEALAEPNGPSIADFVVPEAAKTREIVTSPPNPKYNVCVNLILNLNKD